MLYNVNKSNVLKCKPNLAYICYCPVDGFLVVVTKDLYLQVQEMLRLCCELSTGLLY